MSEEPIVCRMLSYLASNRVTFRRRDKTKLNTSGHIILKNTPKNLPPHLIEAEPCHIILNRLQHATPNHQGPVAEEEEDRFQELASLGARSPASQSGKKAEADRSEPSSQCCSCLGG
jgi:hypothetical protein